MADKKGVFLFEDWLELLNQLSAAEFKRAVNALMNYTTNGEEIPQNFSKLAKSALTIFTNQYELSSKKRKASAERIAKWRANKGSSEQESVESDRYSDVTLQSCNGNKTSCNCNVTPLPKPEPKPEPKPLSPLTPLSREDGENAERERGDGFARFWEVYPRKQHKVAAEEEWNRISPGNELTDEIIGGVTRWSTSRQWNQEGTRFVPMPEKFLHNRQWEDEPPGGDAPPTTFDTQEFFNAALKKSLGEEGTG